MAAPPANDRPLRLAPAYALMVVVAVGVFLLLRVRGETLRAPTQVGATASGAHVPAPGDVVLHVLLALAAVMVVGQVLGRLFVYLGQPPVIGEVVGGILLGPSLLGRLSPDAAEFLLPETVSPYLGMIAQLGVILYMFLVGLELNAGVVKKRAYTTLFVSHASILCPFLLGAALALFLYPRLSSNDVPFTSFSLFLGVAMSITAFPVLARILTDRGISRTDLGVLALACAAVGDATAWCLLAFVVGVVQAKVGEAAQVVLWSAGYIGFLFLVVRPLIGFLLARYERERLTRGTVALVLLALLLSALATEAIGLHAIFGAFLLGAVIPHDSTLAHEFTRRTEDLATVLLLPAFFAFTGMRTQIGLLSDVEGWLICGAITVTATAGKFAGTLAAARFCGLDWRTSASLGALMNTRGLMELIVLNVGLDLHVISPALFTMMVLMALATTTAASPLLWMLERRGITASDPASPPAAIHSGA